MNRPRRTRRTAREGSVLVIVLIMGVLVTVVSLAMISRVTTDARITAAHDTQTAAANALDSTLDYAIAQVVARKSTAAQDPEDHFTNTLRTPAKSLFTRENRMDYGALEILATKTMPCPSGNLFNGGKWRIDPANPMNADDPDRGLHVSKTVMGIAARGAVTGPEFAGKRRHGVAFIERRDGYMFNYAVFTSTNMLRVTGLMGAMTIGGPSFSNIGVFISPSDSMQLTFDGTLYTAGGFYVPEGANAASRSTLRIWNGTTQNGGKQYFSFKQPYPNRFADKAFYWSTGVAVTNSAGVTTTFAEAMNRLTFAFASGTGTVYERGANRALQTFEHGVTQVPIVGIPNTGIAIAAAPPRAGDADYDAKLRAWNETQRLLANLMAGPGAQTLQPLSPTRPHPTSTPGPFDDPSRPGFYDIDSERPIDAPRPDILGRAPGSTDADALKAQTLEQGKIALQSSLYLVVENDGTVTAFNNPDRALDYKGSGDRAAWKAANPGALLDLGDTVRPAYNEKREGLTPLPRRTLYDNQQKQTVTLVDIDVGALKDRIESRAVTYADGTPWNITDQTVNPSKYPRGDTPEVSRRGWNGVMYIDVENPNRRFRTVDSLKKWTVPGANATDTGRTAVRLINGGRVPVSATFDNKSADPSARAKGAGFTLATNAALYVQGSLNADGLRATGTNTEPDNGVYEAPVALWADMVRALSANFDPLGGLVVPKPRNTQQTINGLSSEDYRDGAYPFINGSNAYNYGVDVPAGSDIEIAAALVTGDHDGLTSYMTGGTRVSEMTSNGVQNIAGFIEQFRGRSQLRIRGSIVNLWKPKSHFGRYENGYFTNATRDFGFARVLAEGMMPPATPVTRTYRKLRFYEISEADYERLKTCDTVNDWLRIIEP